MKTKIILVALMTFSLQSFAQYGICKCGEDLDRDIRTFETNFDRTNTKNYVYEYFKGTEDKRREKKSNLNFGTTANAIIEGLPVSSSSFLKIGSGSSNVSNIYTESITEQFVSDENLNILIKSFLPDQAFTNYETCLTKCNEYARITSEGGIQLRNVSSSEDMVVLELKWTSNPPGNNTKIKHATYSSGNIIGGKKFIEGLELKDRQVIYEQIKLDPNESFVATISIEPGTGQASYSIPARRKVKNSTDTPLGTIVATTLNYEDFLRLNGLPLESDINKRIWVPCDGRDVGTDEGTFGAFNGGKVPDLRGLFLRGANDMGNWNSSVPQAISDYLSPSGEAKPVGVFQDDAYENHFHGLAEAGMDVQGGGSSGTARINYGDNGPWGGNKIGMSKGASETRPKNVSVYYYIKIR